MSITVHASNPINLLTMIKKAINDGKVDTWSCDSDGDFSHRPPQWKGKAWLRPKTGDDRIVFNILPPKNTELSKEMYGVYHGRFAEMLLTHFDQDFINLVLSAMPTSGDIVDSTSA